MSSVAFVYKIKLSTVVMESISFLVGLLICFTDIFNSGRMWVDSMSLCDSWKPAPVHSLP